MGPSATVAKVAPKMNECNLDRSGPGAFNFEGLDLALLYLESKKPGSLYMMSLIRSHPLSLCASSTYLDPSPEGFSARLQG